MPLKAGTPWVATIVSGEPAWLLGPDVEPARRFEKPVVIGTAAWATLKMDRRARIDAGRIRTGELQLNVGLQDLGPSSAARISIAGAQELVEVTKIGHEAASFSSDRAPAAAILLTSLPVAANSIV
jgi:hypothetical protein